MRIECKVLNNDEVAEKLGVEPERKWARFVGDTSNVAAFMELMEEGEIDPSVTEVWWHNGKACILDIPFEKFNEMMERPKKDMYVKPGDFSRFDWNEK